MIVGFPPPLEFLSQNSNRRHRTNLVSNFQIKTLNPREIKQVAHIFMAEGRDVCRQADSNILPLDNKGVGKQS